MGSYAKIERAIWNSRTYRSLEDSAKLLYQYFLQCEHGNILGCFVCRPGYIMEDMGWPKAKVMAKIKELEDAKLKSGRGLIMYDQETSLVLITNHLCKDKVKSRQQQDGACRIVETLPYSNNIFNSLIDIIKALDYPMDMVLDTLSHRVSHTVSIPQEPSPSLSSPIPTHTHAPDPADPDGAHFEEFWEKIPRPMKRSLSKPQVQEKYVQALNGALPLQKKARATCVSHGELVMAIVAAGKYYEKHDTPPDKYPMVTTWLNQMRWTGDYGPPGARPKVFRFLQKCPNCKADHSGMEVEKCLQCGEPLKVKVSDGD